MREEWVTGAKRRGSCVWASCTQMFSEGRVGWFDCVTSSGSGRQKRSENKQLTEVSHCLWMRSQTQIDTRLKRKKITLGSTKLQTRPHAADGVPSLSTWCHHSSAFKKQCALHTVLGKDWIQWDCNCGFAYRFCKSCINCWIDCGWQPDSCFDWRYVLRWQSGKLD